MKIEDVSRNVAIRLSLEQFRRLEERDFLEEPEEQALWEILKELKGVEDNVEYNGHFGPNIYLTIDEEADEEEIIRAVEEYVK